MMTCSPSPPRRALLAGGLAAALLAVAKPAFAQGMTDERRTRWLRDGLTPPAAAPGARRRTQVVEGFRGDRVVRLEVLADVSRDLDVYFPHDSAALTPQAVATLEVLGRLLAGDLSAHSYLIAGHTNALGGFEHNMDLSRRRAATVRDHLIRAFAIAPDRLFTVGFGPTRPKDPGAPASPVNRRVEVALVAGVFDR